MRSMLTITLAFIVLSLYGQESKDWTFSAGYSGGVFLHPGLNLGTERIIHQKIKERKGKVVKSFRHDIMLGAQGGFYYHRNYQTGLWGQTSLAWRRTKIHHKNLKYRSINLGVGTINTWVPNSYRVEDDHIINASSRSYTYLLLAPSIEWGRNFQNKLGPFTGWYIRPKVQWHLPYFQGSNQYFLFETGVNF